MNTNVHAVVFAAFIASSEAVREVVHRALSTLYVDHSRPFSTLVSTLVILGAKPDAIGGRWLCRRILRCTLREGRIGVVAGRAVDPRREAVAVRNDPCHFFPVSTP